MFDILFRGDADQQKLKVHCFREGVTFKIGHLQESFAVAVVSGNSPHKILDQVQTYAEVLNTLIRDPRYSALFAEKPNPSMDELEVGSGSRNP